MSEDPTKAETEPVLPAVPEPANKDLFADPLSDPDQEAEALQMAKSRLEIAIARELAFTRARCFELMAQIEQRAVADAKAEAARKEAFIIR